MNGKDLRLFVGGNVFASSTSCEYDVQAELYEVSHPSSGVWKGHKAGMKSWKVSCTRLVLNSDNFTDASSLIGSTVALSFIRRSAAEGEKYLGGNAICSRARITATVGALVKGTFEFTGDGELKVLTISNS